MRITDILIPNCIELDGKVSTKLETIDMLVDLMSNSGNIVDKSKYRKAILDREELSSTGVGEEIAIPHGKTDAVKKPTLSAMIIKEGVDYDSIDGMSVKLIFMIAAPDTEDNVHLDVLSRLSVLLMDENFKINLMAAQTKEEFLQVIDRAEREKFEEPEEKVQEDNAGYRVLAVTACPTGIAHTYMAAEALENKAADMGISFKVETNGSGGAKNILTAEDIERAECIIVAADKNVEMARFNGKKVIKVKVADGIHKTEKLLTRAVNGDAPVYTADNNESVEKEIEEESTGRKIYKHLMNGVSHMLPFVIGGGILIALAFLVDKYEINPDNFGKNTPLAAFFKTTGEYAFSFMLPVLAGYIAMSIGDRPALAVGFVGGYMANIGGSGFLGALAAGFAAGYLVLGLKKLFDKLPKSLEGTKPVLLYPFFGILLIGLAMTLIINPPVSAINNGLTNFLNSMNGTSKIVLGALLGAMMAIDFGGPINKAAYVFGTASIVAKQYDIMAAVMIGGMVPPIAIALSTVLFKKKFTERERQSGLTNFIMGLAFITEGAIPFASSDPLRVIPSCAVGAGIAGAMSMAFNCTLRAPHGGIFVFPVVGNPILYVAALIAGSVAGALILGVLKKTIEENNK